MWNPEKVDCKFFSGSFDPLYLQIFSQEFKNQPFPKIESLLWNDIYKRKLKYIFSAHHFANKLWQTNKCMGPNKNLVGGKIDLEKLGVWTRFLETQE